MKTLVLTVLAVVSTPAWSQKPANPTSKPAEIVPKTVDMVFKSARFHIVQLGTARADQYLLDTETGRLWQLVVNKDNKQVLQPVPFVDPLAGEMDCPLSDEVMADYQKKIQQLRMMRLDTILEKK